jgi:hypothetical protein
MSAFDPKRTLDQVVRSFNCCFSADLVHRYNSWAYRSRCTLYTDDDSNLWRNAAGHMARIGAPLSPAFYYQALLTAGVAWLVAFSIFLLVYGPMLVGAKQTS